MNKNRHAESGSVIYWIFIAVALFAALSFAVSNIGRSGGHQGMEELARMRATDIMQYAGAMQRGIRTMRINGVDETAICFHADQWGHASYDNPPCANASRVFHPNGGGISFQEGIENWYDETVSLPEQRTWIFSARYEIENVGTDGGTASSEDANVDLLMVTAPLRDNVCEALNLLLDYDAAPQPVPAGTYDDLRGNKFAGAYTGEAGSKIGDLGRERCVREPGTPAFNMYYKVILAR